jgi:carbohydrate kinase (thermoresistant glucokinase family)
VTTSGPYHVVLMGVSGSGKSTVGELLAEHIDAEFTDGDALHPRANVEKMESGLPLNDGDREPWLKKIGETFAQAPGSLVIACSALKKSYRDLIRAADASVVFIHLEGSQQLLEDRMTSRSGHFMPPSLLASQLETLEPLDAAEPGVVLDIAASPAELARSAKLWLEKAS